MRIRGSKRGLTFSFSANESFTVGTKYRYILDNTKKEIIIVPDKNGKYRVSKKGNAQKPLLDLRNKEIKDMISTAQYIEIAFVEGKIIVNVIEKRINVDGLNDIELADIIGKEQKHNLIVTKEQLMHHDSLLYDMLKTTGLFTQSDQNELEYVFDVASLFSGAGLLDYSFAKDDAFDIKFACDFDKAACETYRKNIGDHILCMDMRNVQAKMLPDVDVIIGGPCCQGYSNANRHNLDSKKTEEKRDLC